MKTDTELKLDLLKEYLDGYIRGIDRNIVEIGDPNKRFKMAKGCLEDVKDMFDHLFAEVPSEPVSHSR